MVSSISKIGVSVVVPRYGLEGLIKFSDEDVKQNERLLEELKQGQQLIIVRKTHTNKNQGSTHPPLLNLLACARTSCWAENAIVSSTTFK